MVAARKSKRRSLARSLGRWLVVMPVVAVAGYLLLCTLLLAAYRFVPPPVTTVQVQRTVEAVISPEPLAFQRSWRPLDRVAVHVPRAVVAAEDTRFYDHRGFDWEEFAKAREEARRRGRPPRGASTISQQLVKNLFLTTHRSVIRKGFEYPLTFVAEIILPKERILELYVNSVEWGPGVYGVEAAARHHYGIGADQLSREQSARLAALLPAPRSRTPQNVGWYSSIVQQRMAQMGW